MYFVAPSAVTGPFTITITAQLGTGAVASDWKVDMYSFLPVGSDDWELVGDLTGGESLICTTRDAVARPCMHCIMDQGAESSL